MFNITAMLIQAFKTLGKDNVRDKDINRFRSNLSQKQKKKLLIEGKSTTSWIYEKFK